MRWPRLEAVLAGGRLAGLVLLLGLLVLRWWDPGPVEGMRLRVFDQFQKWQPRAETTFPVVIVDIDEASLKELGQWPWPRYMLARMVDRLMADGAAAVGFDIVFAEPDRSAPIDWKSLQSLSPQEVARALADLPANDVVFARSLAHGRVALSVVGLDSRDAAEATLPAEIRVTTPALLGGDPRPALFQFEGLLWNIDALSNAASGIGTISLAPDSDGIVRHAPAAIVVGDRIIPSLGVELLRLATGQKSYAIRRDRAGVSEVIVAGVSIPTDRHGRVYVNFGVNEPARFVSAADLIEGRTEPGRFRGRIVLIGTTGEALYDVKATPLGKRMAGVEIHAQLLETVLSGGHLTRPHYALGMEVTVALLGGLLLIVLVPLIGPRLTLGLHLAGMIVLLAGSWLAFSQWRFLLDASYPVFSGTMIYLLLVYVKYTITDRRRREINLAFGQYLSPVLVRRLVDHPELLKLGGEQRTITVMFSDIRNFTTISEKFRDDPQGLTALINRFLTPMTDIVLARSGTIDKYIGDSIMAFWNAPIDVANHAAEACASALEMAAALRRLNDELRAEGAATGDAGPDLSLPQAPSESSLAMGIGINTGGSVVGNLGSKQRFNYSALGDAVNLASRLESLTKLYGVPILISETTRRLAPAFAALEIDLIAVKGKTEAIRTYGLLGQPDETESEEFRRLAATHESMVNAYRSRDWRQASALGEECRALRPDLDRLYSLYLGRIEEFQHTPPAADWNGVYIAKSK